MMIVGLTGGIGSGKTTVLKEFEKLKVPVYISDVEAKRLMNVSTPIQIKIKKLLGEGAYNKQGLDRAYVADKVFYNKELLHQLNKIVHPAVHQDFKKFVSKQIAPYIIYENAILFENKNERFCDKVIVVAAPEKMRIARVMKRDKVTKEAVMARINNQWSQEDKIAKADIVIENDNLFDLKDKVLQIHNHLTNIN